MKSSLLWLRMLISLAGIGWSFFGAAALENFWEEFNWTGCSAAAFSELCYCYTVFLQVLLLPMNDFILGVSLGWDDMTIMVDYVFYVSARYRLTMAMVSLMLISISLTRSLSFSFEALSRFSNFWTSNIFPFLCVACSILVILSCICCDSFVTSDNYCSI